MAEPKLADYLIKKRHADTLDESIDVDMCVRIMFSEYLHNPVRNSFLKTIQQVKDFKTKKNLNLVLGRISNDTNLTNCLNLVEKAVCSSAKENFLCNITYFLGMFTIDKLKNISQYCYENNKSFNWQMLIKTFADPNFSLVNSQLANEFINSSNNAEQRYNSFER